MAGNARTWVVFTTQLAAFFPLFYAFFWINILDRNILFALIWFLLGFIPLIILIGYFEWKAKNPGAIETINVQTCTNETGQVSILLATFLVPFVAISTQTWAVQVGAFIMLTFIFAAMVRSGQWLFNPIFVLMGYNFYKVRGKKSGALIESEYLLVMQRKPSGKEDFILVGPYMGIEPHGCSEE